MINAKIYNFACRWNINLNSICLLKLMENLIVKDFGTRRRGYFIKRAKTIGHHGRVG